MRVKSIVSFATSLLAAILITWLALERSELKLAEAQRDQYRQKLKGASPDEAAAKIAQLEHEIAAQHTASIPASAPKEDVWPALSSRYIVTLSDILRRYRVGSLAVFFVDQNSELFRQSLNEAFRRALWPMPTAHLTNSVEGAGITLRSRANEVPAFVLASTLREVGYQVSHITTENIAGNIEIYVSSKPQ
jgi:hypothetical protein